MRQKHPDPALGQLTLDAIVASYANAIQAMLEPPIVIGHSMGGLITQILLNYNQNVVPESRRAGRGALGGIARIDFQKKRAPLLLIAGSTDHIIPASLNRSNFEKYKDSGSITDFKEFPGRTHFGIGQQGWEEINLFRGCGQCF